MCGEGVVVKLFLLIVPMFSFLTVFVSNFLQQSIDMYYSTHTVTIKFHFTLKHQLVHQRDGQCFATNIDLFNFERLV